MIELSWKNSDGSETGRVVGRNSIITIGRDGVNDVSFPSGNLSSFHAAIVENDTNEWFLRDIGSLLGTLVNGRGGHRRILREGDSVSIPDYTMRVEKLTPLDSDIQSSKKLQITIADMEEKHPFSGMPDIEETAFSFTGAPKNIASTISDLLKINDFNSLVGQILKETCDTLMKAKFAYAAIFGKNQELVLKSGIRTHGDNLPPIPRKLYDKFTREKNACFLKTSKDELVALAPIKDARNLLGCIYLHGIPETSILENQKNALSSLLENEILLRHVGQSHARISRPGIQGPEQSFRWKKKFVGNRKTESMQAVWAAMERYSRNDSTLILLGDTGTGKSYFAEAVHSMSGRAWCNFVKVDLNSIPESLVESELFGTVKSAYTGAINRKGYFEHASGGTLFLDEIEDLSLNVQAKLRSVLETKIIARIGEPTGTIPVDVRIIAAVNKDIKQIIENGKFREDLYERLGGNFSTVKFPRLRERKEDIPLLAHYLIDNVEMQHHVEGFSRAAIKALMSYDWPGNLRSLHNVVMAAVETVEMAGRKVVSVSDLPDEITGRGSERHEELQPSFPTLNEVEKEHILKALKLSDGNKSKAAGLLGIPRQTLYNKLREFDT